MTIRFLLFGQIAAALEGNDGLEALDINGNNIGPEGMLALANALKGKESLQRLEISYNPIEANGAKALIDIIKFDMKVSSSTACAYMHGSNAFPSCTSDWEGPGTFESYNS